MYRKEVNATSPLRILERSIHGGLGRGHLGVVMARAGTGKTAFLVQLGLDDAMRGRKVVHVSTEQSLEHMHAWYDAIFGDLATHTELEDREDAREGINRHRLIQCYANEQVTPERLQKLLEMYSEHLNFEPDALLIDGYSWDLPKVRIAADIGGFKNLAKRFNMELWIAAQTHREVTGNHPTALTGPCAPFAELIEVAVFLEPHHNHVTVRLLKDHDDAVPPDTHLELDPDTMRLLSDSEAHSKVRLPVHAYTLLSGGARGSENEFGIHAEKWGMKEITFSFPGRTAERSRGLVELSEGELRQGEVSASYVQSHLHRTFPKTPNFQKTLQSIWHQVATAGQVFVIGAIQEDNTVKGGTGWAAELARHFNKPLHVFDQEKKCWFRWLAGQWVSEESPRITRRRFTGTGTRFLTDEGKAAIRKLFDDSFGSAAS